MYQRTSVFENHAQCKIIQAVEENKNTIAMYMHIFTSAQKMAVSIKFDYKPPTLVFALRLLKSIKNKKVTCQYVSFIHKMSRQKNQLPRFCCL